VVTGGEVHVAGGAGIDASGGTGGGTVLLGGDAYGKGPEKNAANTSVAQSATIRADALRAGDGGQVVVWSDGRTIFDGTISARGGADNGDGGMVETSGHTLAVGNAASVDTSAPRGAFGEWLLDPADFVIAASGGDMSGTTLSANLNTTDVAILSSAGQSGANGDIFVNDAVTWNAGTTLTLSAYRDVNVNADITATGDAAGLVINTEILDIPGAADRSYSLASGARVTLSGANPSLSIFGRQYTVINTLEALQNMNQNLAGHYALGSDIDASATGGWNSGAGFMPVGTMNNSFSGIFDGLGHTITALTINRPSMDYVGLFGITGTSQIKHVCMMHPFITGRDRVGGLVGSNAGDIEECYSKEGDVKGAAGSSLNNLSRAGGLVGANLGSISRSHSTGKVTGGYYLGGLVGLNGGRIEESHSESTLTYYGAGGDFMGGLVGENQASGIISTSYSSGAITGDYYVGGLVGRNYGIISNSYSENDLTEAGELRQYFGGFVGGNLVLRNI
jgi:hypothetical protein